MKKLLILGLLAGGFAFAGLFSTAEASHGYGYSSCSPRYSYGHGSYRSSYYGRGYYPQTVYRGHGHHHHHHGHHHHGSYRRSGFGFYGNGLSIRFGR